MLKITKIFCATLCVFVATMPQGFIYAQFYTGLNNPQTQGVITDPNSYIFAFAFAIVIFFISFFVTLKS